MNDVKRTVYIDMDGVLADFDKGFFNISGGKTAENTPDPELWEIIGKYGKVKFFSELPWMPGGQELWGFVTDNFLKVKILSACGRNSDVDKETPTGKLTWLRHHLTHLSMDDIILVTNKHKKRHYSKPDDIIIDDTPVVIHEWVKKGGIGILHKDSGETISVLKQYV